MISSDIRAQWLLLRIFHPLFLVGMLLLGWIAEMIAAQRDEPEKLSVYYWAFVAYALVVVVTGLTRERWVRTKPNDPKGDAKRWYALQMVGLSSGTAIFFCGAFARMFLAVPFMLCVPFYAIGLFLWFWWHPRLPEAIAS